MHVNNNCHNLISLNLRANVLLQILQQKIFFDPSLHNHTLKLPDESRPAIYLPAKLNDVFHIG